MMSNIEKPRQAPGLEFLATGKYRENLYE